MFTNKPFTENKAVINVKTLQIDLSRNYIYKKSISYEMQQLMQIDDLLFLNFKNRNSKSEKWILVMLSITFTCCKNIHILIHSLVEIKFLHLLWRFHGDIFHGLGE